MRYSQDAPLPEPLPTYREARQIIRDQRNSHRFQPRRKPGNSTFYESGECDATASYASEDGWCGDCWALWSIGRRPGYGDPDAFAAVANSGDYFADLCPQPGLLGLERRKAAYVLAKHNYAALLRKPARGAKRGVMRKAVADLSKVGQDLGTEWAEFMSSSYGAEYWSPDGELLEIPRPPDAAN